MDWQEKAEWVRENGYRPKIANNENTVIGSRWIGTITLAKEEVIFYGLNIPDTFRLFYARARAHWEVENHKHEWEWNYLTRAGHVQIAGMICGCGAKLHQDDVQDFLNSQGTHLKSQYKL